MKHLNIEQGVVMYYFFKYLGWVNITLLVLIITHFILRRVNKYGFKNKSKFLRRIATAMSKIHPYIVGLLLVTIIQIVTIGQWAHSDIFNDNSAIQE